MKEEFHMRNLKRALSLAMASIMVLGMMVVGAGALRFLHILGERVGREHHDGQRAQIIALALADAARGLEAVHDGHLDIPRGS